MTLGERIKHMRLEQDLSQPELATKIGIEQSYLSKLENDKALPSNEIFDGLLLSLNLTVDEFMAPLSDMNSSSKLLQVQAIRQWYESMKQAHVSRSQRWLLLCNFLIVLGVASLYAGLSAKLFPEAGYDYVSLGIIYPDELDDKLIRWTRYYQTKTREQEIAALLERQPRIDESRVLRSDYLGDTYRIDTAQGRRVYRLEGTYEQPRRINGLLEVIGVLLLCAGVMTMVLNSRYVLKSPR